MPYDEGALQPTVLTSIAWANAWTRLFTRDTTSTAETYSDAEIEAVNEAQRWTFTNDAGVTTSYYRPHLAAAALIEADPDRATQESTLQASITTRDVASVARAIRRAGQWIDAAIYAAAGDAPPSLLTIKPTF